LLASRFGKVKAVDFSPEMLRRARKKVARAGNVEFFESDIRKLSKLGLSVDVCFAINSILHPDFRDVHKSLLEIHKSLKKGGMFIGIFPSMEAVLYNNKLVYEKEMRKCRDKKEALSNTHKKVEDRKYDYITGIYSDCSEQQRFYYEAELLMKLGGAGFSSIEVEKVKYPWGTESGDYDNFFGKPQMWDWYVRARKE